MDIIPAPFAWYLAGPLIGLSVAGLYATTNRHLGISGAYVNLVNAIKGRGSFNTWRIWFLAGTVIGAGLIALLSGNPQRGLNYGELGEQLPLPVLIAVLLVGSILIGYGARTAGGCTSGHGISGCATRSPGSFAAVITFVVSAVIFALLLDALTGGVL